MKKVRNLAALAIPFVMAVSSTLAAEMPDLPRPRPADPTFATDQCSSLAQWRTAMDQQDYSSLIYLTKIIDLGIMRAIEDFSLAANPDGEWVMLTSKNNKICSIDHGHTIEYVDESNVLYERAGYKTIPDLIEPCIKEITDHAKTLDKEYHEVPFLRGVRDDGSIMTFYSQAHSIETKSRNFSWTFSNAQYGQDGKPCKIETPLYGNSMRMSLSGISRIFDYTPVMD